MVEEGEYVRSRLGDHRRREGDGGGGDDESTKPMSCVVGTALHDHRSTSHLPSTHTDRLSLSSFFPL